MNEQQIYADGVENISVVDGIVRVDYFRYSPFQSDAEGKPAREFARRVLMSPQSFLRTYNAMNRIVEQLENRGVIERAAAAEETPERQAKES